MMEEKTEGALIIKNVDCPNCVYWIEDKNRFYHSWMHEGTEVQNNARYCRRFKGEYLEENVCGCPYGRGATYPEGAKPLVLPDEPEYGLGFMGKEE